MLPRTIAFATCADEPHLIADDRLLIAPLRAHGFTVVPLIYDRDPLPPDLAAIVIRSCWDYHLQPDVFRGFLAAVEPRQVPIWNPPDILRWNLDKHYLRELATAGVAVPRTLYVPRGPAPALAELLAEHDFTDVVLKPAISLSAHRTWRSDPRQATAHQSTFAEALARGDMLVQAFVPAVESVGELSLVFLDRVYSHAVRKRPRPGDFRVQADHGGTREPIDPPTWVIERAAACLAHIPGPLLYARVDAIVTDDSFQLMELELIDPVLFLAYHPEAPQRLADAIAGRITHQ